MRRRSGNLEDFGLVLYPEEAVEPILAGPTRAAILEWLEEIWSADDLKAVGIKPRRRAVFAGLPGGGKTTLAHHLAARLGLPLVVVESDQVIDKYVGETEQNLGALFRAAQGQEAILFFDEFDTLAHKRTAASQGADRAANNMVNTMLQKLERHEGIVIAATNREDDIDPAVWRRFDLHITLAMPDQEARERIVARYLSPFILPDKELTGLARDLAGASPALIRQLCEAVKRNLVIGPKVGWDMDKQAVFGRIVNAIEPHKDFNRPPLWGRAGRGGSVDALTWPMQREDREVENA